MAKQTEWLVFFYENNDFHRSHKFFKKDLNIVELCRMIHIKKYGY